MKPMPTTAPVQVQTGLRFRMTPVFARTIRHYLDDADLAELRRYLAQHPEAGRIACRSGGVRKLRWAALGRGKRGGVRIAYYWQAHRSAIWLLGCYAKGREDNIPGHLLRQAKERFALEQECTGCPA